MRCEKYRQVCHLMENCDDHGGSVRVWRGVTAVSTLRRNDLTFIVSVSLRKYDVFS